MMKKVGLFVTVLNLMLILAACGCQHAWTDATCQEPATCSECGETQGEPAGHIWQDATCQAPKTCTVCGATEGKNIEHQWQDATCQAPETCALCGETEGEIGKHHWDIVCRAACTVCGMDNPDTPGHQWVSVSEATTRCNVCGEKQIEPHTCNWVEATCTSHKYCTICLEGDGTLLGHTLANDEVISRCETCHRDLEVFRDAKGKILYITDFETAADGTYADPVTVRGNMSIRWYQDGVQDALKFWDAFCVNGKMYYLGSTIYPVSKNTRDDLMDAAQAHVQYQYAKFYEDKEHDQLFLSSDKMLTDDMGQVYAVVDVYGNRYILIHKGQPGYHLENTIVLESDWTS